MGGIMEQYKRMIASKKVPMDSGGRMALWYLPCFCIGLGGYFLISSIVNNNPNLLWDRPFKIGFIVTRFPLLLMIVVGAFFPYRAKISSKLTFVQDKSSLQTKIEIIKALMDSFGWDIQKQETNYLTISACGGWFRNSSIITVLYDENGYYINWIVYSWRAGNYCSILGTKNVVKKLKELIDDPNFGKSYLPTG
jgi:hypothetical protein